MVPWSNTDRKNDGPPPYTWNSLLATYDGTKRKSLPSWSWRFNSSPYDPDNISLFIRPGWRCLYSYMTQYEYILLVESKLSYVHHWDWKGQQTGPVTWYQKESCEMSIISHKVIRHLPTIGKYWGLSRHNLSMNDIKPCLTHLFVSIIVVTVIIEVHVEFPFLKPLSA